MRPPIAFVYGNCVFADGLDDGWAAFRVEVSSYEWLAEDGKRARFLALLGGLEALEADVQILRVGRRWELGALCARVGWRRRGETAPPREGRRGRMRERDRAT